MDIYTKTEIGHKLAEVLQLKRKKNERYDTLWGDKTDLGLYETIKRIIDNKE